MKKITKEYTVYTFNELNKETQNKLIESYKKNEFNMEIHNDNFHQDTIEYLKSEFVNSDLEIYYSLSYCQGDGLYITGNLNLLDMLEKIKEQFNNKELKTLKHYINESDGFVKLHNNNWYYDFHYEDNAAELRFALLDNISYRYSNINYELIQKFSFSASQFLYDLSKELEKQGYKDIYEIDDEEAIEWYECNDFMFLENGEFFYD